ncbi:MAG: hypothetical protein KJO03_01250 [Gammaproteobacteria bacterium]|nr:hypothetical protein [Gammaproteobacteria bacterium]NNJ49062.1 hypothetical protein [Gammaproteobacteria bacterium]
MLEINVFPRKSQPSRPALQFAIAFLMSVAGTAHAEDDGSFGLTSFAFASYLGTGFYTTSGQNVFVLQMPFEHVIKEKTDTEAGWKLKLPITVGFINFDSIVIEEVPGVSDVGTVTFLPGLAYQYPVTRNWTLTPFVDYGFARELAYTSNVLIIGTGLKSTYNVHFEDAMFTLGNRFLYAREQTKESSSDADYSLVETGLNYRVTSTFFFDEEPIFSNLYYINFYYPNNLVFYEQTPNPIRVGIEHEVGITLSNIPDFLFFEKPELGLGIRYGNNVKVYRLVFGAPF